MQNKINDKYLSHLNTISKHKTESMVITVSVKIQHSPWPHDIWHGDSLVHPCRLVCPTATFFSATKYHYFPVFFPHYPCQCIVSTPIGLTFPFAYVKSALLIKSQSYAFTILHSDWRRIQPSVWQIRQVKIVCIPEFILFPQNIAHCIFSGNPAQHLLIRHSSPDSKSYSKSYFRGNKIRMEPYFIVIPYSWSLLSLMK